MDWRISQEKIGLESLIATQKNTAQIYTVQREYISQHWTSYPRDFKNQVCNK